MLKVQSHVRALGITNCQPDIDARTRERDLPLNRRRAELDLRQPNGDFRLVMELLGPREAE